VRIFHIATAADWAQAQASGHYTTSTLGLSLQEVGYIHAAREEQWRAVKRRYYAEVYVPLLLLEIDTDLLDSPVVEERPGPGTEETFPHIYGPLNTAAVVGTRSITRSKLPPSTDRPTPSRRRPLP